LTRDTPIAAYGGVVAWSDYDAATARYRLVIRRGALAVHASMASSRRPFDVSLGPDSHGRVVALYTRCRTANHDCDVYRYDVLARRERKDVSVSSPTMDEAWPVQWRDHLAFVRRARAYVVDGYSLRPDPRGKGGGGELMDCDVPYVKSLSTPTPSRRLDRGLCAPTTGMSIRGERIVQVTDLDQGGAGSESQVRLLRTQGGAGRVLDRARGGEGGYSPFASPSQSATDIYLTRTGFREGTSSGVFLRFTGSRRTPTVVQPNMRVAGRMARDERGAYWYVQAPEPPMEDHYEPPFCVSPLEPCRLVRASASPFSPVTRALPPRLRVTVEKSGCITRPSSAPIVLSGDLTRTIVRRSAIVRREPLRGVSLELLHSDRPEGRGPFGRPRRVTCECRAPRSVVASERLGLEPSVLGVILEDVGDADCGLDALDPALHQLEVRVVAEPEVVQPRSLGTGNVTGRGIALRVSVCVVADEGLPVLVTRPFDRLSNLFPGECHGSQPPLPRSGRLAPTLPACVSSGSTDGCR
jgi:hypothetical protein